MAVIPSRLYAILDDASLRDRGLPFGAVARGVLRAEPAIVQYRAKGRAVEESRAELSALLLLRDELSPRTQIYMNDSAELADAVRADGVHVGQSDMAVEVVRARFPTLRVGISTHSRPELERALESAPDYVAIGPIFPTSSKANPEPVVTAPLLRELSSLARSEGIALVGIGGITPARAKEIARVVDYIAVIAALLEGADRATAETRVFENAKSLDRLMGGPAIDG